MVNHGFAMVASDLAEEKIRGTIWATITGKRTLFSGYSNVNCYLVFTSERIIIVRQGSQIFRPYGPDPRSAPGSYGLSPESLRQLKAENLAIAYSDIIKVQIGTKWLNVRAHFHTSSGIQRFMWAWPSRSLRQVEYALRTLLPESVTIEMKKLD